MPEFKLEQGQLLHVLIPDRKTKPAQIKFSMAVVVAAYDQFFVVTLRSVEGWMSFFYDQIVEEHSESPERMEVLILKIDGEPVFSAKKDGEYTYMPEPKNMKVETHDDLPLDTREKLDQDIVKGFINGSMLNNDMDENPMELSKKITDFIKAINSGDYLSTKIPEDLFDSTLTMDSKLYPNVEIEPVKEGYFKRLLKALFNIK